MPLVVGAVLTPPPDVDTPPEPPWSPPQVGTIRATWTDPDGTVWELSNTSTDVGYFTTNAIAGWGSAPVTIVTDPLASGGEEVRHIRSEPRRITWPLHIHGEDADGVITNALFQQRYRALMRAFTMTTQRRRPGVLRIEYTDGKAREIEAFYEDGFTGNAGENWVSANPVLTLFCPDGFWRDTQPQTIRRAHETGGSPFLQPFLSVSNSQVLGESTIYNTGDVDAWPSWTITGPASAVTATNVSTGEAFTLTHDLLAAEQMTITMTRARPLVRGPAGQNLVGALNWPGAVLWSLVPGRNDINFSVAGSADGTAIELAFHPRYEAA